MTEARALVARAPGSDHKEGSNWTLEPVLVPDSLKDGELLVSMIASGICHTDFVTTSAPAGTPGYQYPRITGHEGSGYVKAIGPNVSKDVKVGDPVLLSFDSCNDCESCEDGHPAYCATFIPKNIVGQPSVFTSADHEKTPISGKFFGQSSFASLSVVNQASVLPAKDLIRNKDELQLFAPLGCGIQTGAGAVLNIAKPGKRDRVMVLGLGGVGLTAVMAAAINGCEQIIAVDRVKSRIEIAKSLGATHGYDTSGVEDLTAGFKEVAGGVGPTVVIDTTGVPLLIESSYASIAPRGKFVLIGVPGDPTYGIKCDIRGHMMNGTQLLGCCEGDSLPAEFIPKLIEHYRAGRLAIDRIVKYYKAEDFKTAVSDMHSGEAIKPVILW